VIPNGTHTFIGDAFSEVVNNMKEFVDRQPVR
jgi:hypothetical protein